MVTVDDIQVIMQDIPVDKKVLENGPTKGAPVAAYKEAANLEYMENLVEP